MNQETTPELFELLQAKSDDALSPGFQVEFDPEEAAAAGAFIEDALNEQDAIDSVLDLED